MTVLMYFTLLMSLHLMHKHQSGTNCVSNVISLMKLYKLQRTEVVYVKIINKRKFFYATLLNTFHDHLLTALLSAKIVRQKLALTKLDDKRCNGLGPFSIFGQVRFTI